MGLASALAIAQRGRSVCVLEREAASGHRHQHAQQPGDSCRHLLSEGQSQGAALREWRAHALRVLRAAQRAPPSLREADRGARRARGSGARSVAGARRLTTASKGWRSWTQAFIRDARAAPRSDRVALYSPNTGMLDAEALVRTLAGSAQEQRRVSAARIAARRSRYRRGWRRTADASRIDRRAHGGQRRRPLRRRGLRDARWQRRFSIYPCRGEYAELVPAKRDLVNGLVYPLPAHAWTRRAYHQDRRRQRDVRTDCEAIRIGRTTTRAIAFRSKIFSSLRGSCSLSSGWRI